MLFAGMHEGVTHDSKDARQLGVANAGAHQAVLAFAGAWDDAGARTGARWLNMSPIGMHEAIVPFADTRGDA